MIDESIKNPIEWVDFLENSKAENFTGDNFYITNTNQFVLETEHPELPIGVFANAFQRTEFPDRVQYSIDPKSQLVPTSWVDKKLKQHLNYGISITPHEAWAIEYKDGGYQAVHNHTQQPSLISMIIFFDAITDEQKVQPTDGCTYTLMPHSDGNQICLHFNPYPGKVIIMDGNVFHGTYPCKAPRRCFVVNFKFEYITMEPTIDYSKI